MAKVKLLAFLVCERWTRHADNRITLRGLFDTIVLPKIPIRGAKDDTFYVFYRLDVREPCVVSLSVLNPEGSAAGHGVWKDSIEHVGTVQTAWPLGYSQFKNPGTYTLEFSEQDEDGRKVVLTTWRLVVKQEDYQIP